MADTPAPSSKPSHAQNMRTESKLELFKSAYDEGKSAVKDQLSDLSNYRARATQIMTLVASATAFLVGTAFNLRDHRPPPPEVIACMIGLAAIDVVALCSLAFLLIGVVHIRHPYAPVTRMEQTRRGTQVARWKQAVNPVKLVRRWIDPEVGGTDEIKYYRQLALMYGDFIGQNKQYLRQIRFLYYIVILSGFASLLGWVCIVALVP